MNEDLKKRWVEALRSGKYEQGQGALKSSDGKYCCLGVLAEIDNILQSQGEQWVVLDEKGRPSFGFLPKSYMDKIGLSSHASGHLINLNDGYSSFWAIADWIEENL